MNKALVIYDATGRIWSIIYGEEEAPQGLTCMFVDIPDGATLTKIDVTDLGNPKPIFEYLPETDIGRLQKSMKQLEESASVIATATSIVAETFTDEQALKVPTLYDFWNFKDENGNPISYKAGKRVRHEGVLYKVLQDHISQEDWSPTLAPSLFAKVLVEDPNVVTEWVQPDSTNGYSKGDKVTLDGVTYESQVDNNIWKPSDVGEDIWKVVTE